MKGCRLARRLPFGAIAVGLLVAAPFVLSNSWISFVVGVFLWTGVAAGWDLLAGAGYISLATAAWYGLGAYSTAVCMNHFHLDFYSSIVISAAWIGVLAIVVGAPLLRLRSHYFIMGTFITAEVVYLLMEQANFLGLQGASPVQLPIPVVGDPRAFDRYFYFVSLGFVVVAAAVILAIRSTRMGLALRAIGQDESTAVALGVANVRYKLLAFGISSAIIALAGGVNAYWVGYLQQSTAFSLLITIKAIVMAVTGGIGLVAGAAVGSTVIQAIEQIAGPNLAQLSQLVYGLLVIAIVVALPAGLVPGVRAIARRLVRRRPRG